MVVTFKSKIMKVLVFVATFKNFFFWAKNNAAKINETVWHPWRLWGVVYIYEASAVLQTSIDSMFV